MAASPTEQALDTFFGSDDFPIDWEPGEKELFWILDDLHCPNPVSPLFFDIGGWWLTCDHMFRRFGTPFASDWIAKNINGYVYTAAVPANPSIRVDGMEYEALYTPRVPKDPGYAGKIGSYLGWVLPHYAEHFLDWWRDRLRPELERNFARLDEFDTDGASMLDLAVLLEDAIDVHDRAWKIHWMLNFAQFSSTTALNATIEEVHGEADPGLMGRLQSSVEDRNWDSIEDLWRMKEEIKDDAELRAAFEGGETARDVLAALEGSERGRRFVEDRLTPHQQAFGYKAIWSHEFVFKTWVEDPAPIIEAVRGYLATDYDYPANIKSVADDLEAAKREVMEGVEGGGPHEAPAGARPLARHEPAHARPPLLHRPGRERAGPARRAGDRAQAGRGGRARGPRGRDLPPLQRAAAADGGPVGVRREGAGLRPPRRAGGRLRDPARGAGSAPPPTRRSPSRTTRSGASRTSSTPASRRRPARSRGSRRRPASSRVRRAT